MQSSQIPTKFPVIWGSGAASANIRSVPTTTTDTTAASLTLGWPPATFSPLASGGSPPDGRDANGINQAMTAWLQWAQAGNSLYYDSAFQTAIGGYPKGAVLAVAATPGQFWVSTVENNMTDPDTGGAGWVNSILVEATARANADLAIYQLAGGFSNSTPGTYNWTCPAGVFSVKLEVWGAGGGGGGSENAPSGGAGGGGGGFVKGKWNTVPGTVYQYIIGQGGAGGSQGVGGTGGQTVFSNFVNCAPGGGGNWSDGAFATTPGGGGTTTISGAIWADGISGVAGGLSGEIGTTTCYCGQGGWSYAATYSGNSFVGSTSPIAGLSGFSHGMGGAGGVNGGGGGNGANGCIRLSYGME